MGAIEAKNTTLGRLARMIFGAKTEKIGQLFPAAAHWLPRRRGGSASAQA